MKNDKLFFTSIYCPPYPPKGEYGDRITESAYKTLKDIGINNVFGHYEDSYGEEYLKEALVCSEKSGITYYPRLQLFQKYLAVSGSNIYKGTSYRFLSSKEKEDLKKEFIEKTKMCSKYSSFGGIFFGDESPIGSFEGMAEAKKIFESNFPGFEFHYNCLNYCIDDSMIYGGKESVDYKDLTGNLKCESKNRFNRYRLLIDNYLSVVNPTYLTTDMYPYLTLWPTVPTSIHRGLYELNALFAEYKKKYNVKTFTYIQTGAWNGEVRKVNKAEMALQINVAIAYGHEGIVFFPGFFPNDFLYEPGFDESKNGDCGLLDANSNPTIYADMAKELINKLQKCAPVLLDAKFVGVYSIGKFNGGIDPSIDTNSLVDGDCIYIGKIPDMVIYDGKKIKIDTDSQLLIGVFEKKDGKKAYFIVNNSIVNSTNVHIESECKEAIINGESIKIENVFETNIPAGEYICLY
jgi:hypothetical protein